MRKIFAHRGLPTIAPENTLASFQKCSEIKNLDWIELDIAITADEELIVIHDDFFDRTTNIKGEISNSNYRDIKNASAGFWFSEIYKDEKIPTFRDIVRLVNEHNLNINIELKGVTGQNGYPLSIKMIELIKKELKYLNNNIEILISSFNFILLKLSQEILPDIPRALLYENHAFYPDWKTISEYCGSKTIHLEDKGLTQFKVQEIVNNGYELNVWTVNDKCRANELFQWGVNGIFTDVAHELIHLSRTEGESP
jgi:glycerophosphoryl diester phosphodiesterase